MESRRFFRGSHGVDSELPNQARNLDKILGWNPSLQSVFQSVIDWKRNAKKNTNQVNKNPSNTRMFGDFPLFFFKASF